MFIRNLIRLCKVAVRNQGKSHDCRRHLVLPSSQCDRPIWMDEYSTILFFPLNWLRHWMFLHIFYLHIALLADFDLQPLRMGSSANRLDMNSAVQLSHLQPSPSLLYCCFLKVWSFGFDSYQMDQDMVENELSRNSFRFVCKCCSLDSIIDGLSWDRSWNFLFFHLHLFQDLDADDVSRHVLVNSRKFSFITGWVISLTRVELQATLICLRDACTMYLGDSNAPVDLILFITPKLIVH